MLRWVRIEIVIKNSSKNKTTRKILTQKLEIFIFLIRDVVFVTNVERWVRRECWKSKIKNVWISVTRSSGKWNTEILKWDFISRSFASCQWFILYMRNSHKNITWCGDETYSGSKWKKALFLVTWSMFLRMRNFISQTQNTLHTQQARIFRFFVVLKWKRTDMICDMI